MAEHPRPQRVPGEVERVSLDQLPARGRTASSGYVEAITILPADRAPQFSAVVTGADPVRRGGAPAARIRLAWLGQHRVPGVEAGIRIGFEGMVFLVNGLPTMYNPR
ncbi:hypothetical protein HER39_07315, partial [Arthrobacter deserti]|nr:hypothetical protein [Arthrobacter deserti]